jgi:uncharacterized protein (DUF58 family)
MFPTRNAAGLLVVVGVVCAVLSVPYAVPLLAASVVVGLTLVDMSFARTGPLRWEQTAVSTLARGTPVEFRVRVEFTRARVLRLRQPSPAALSVEPSEARSALLTAALVGCERGVHLLPSPVVRVSGPLGLGACDHSLGESRTVAVFPDLPGARRRSIAGRRARSAEEGRLYDRLGLGTEFESVRDYSPDDDVRQVNWLATSRLGRPMSNQFRVEANRDLMCLIDTGRLMAAPLEGATRLDHALDAVAATAVAAEDAGDRVGVVAFADSVLRVLRPRRRAAEAIVRATFELGSLEVESDYQRAFETVGGFKRALVAIFTDLMDEAAARTLLEAAPVLGRRHAVMVATCSDTDLLAAVSANPRTPHDVLRASVAAELLENREHALEMLRALGATVVEAPPSDLGTACVAGYLRLKRRARL